MARILVVEDDADLRALVTAALRDAGHLVQEAADGVAAARAVEHPDVDLVVLDLLLPHRDGSAVLRCLRERSAVPVIVVSAKDAVWSRIDLLRAGADDYLTKPFDLGELEARVGSLLRRSGGAVHPAAPLVHGDLRVEEATARASVGGRALALTATELRILLALMRRPGRVLSRAALYEEVLGEPLRGGGDGGMKTHVSNLRAKIHAAASGPERIETVWGLGYRMAAPAGTTPPNRQEPPARSATPGGSVRPVLSAPPADLDES